MIDVERIVRQHDEVSLLDVDLETDQSCGAPRHVDKAKAPTAKYATGGMDEDILETASAIAVRAQVSSAKQVRRKLA